MRKTRHTFNVFTAHWSNEQEVPPFLFLAQVDAASSRDAERAVADDIGTFEMYMSAQFADDPRAQGQRHATASEREHLRILKSRWSAR